MRWMSVLLLGMGCAPSLQKTWEWNDTSDPEEQLVQDTGGEMIFQLRINATDREDWVFLDLETAVVSDIEDPEASLDWDLGVRRYNFKLNSSVHGPSTVAVLKVEEDGYDDCLVAPEGEYLEDGADADGDGVPEYVFTEWYDYDISTHILTPKPIYYVIRNRNDLYFKFKIEEYYDSAGTPAKVLVQWEQIEALADETSEE